MRGIFCTVKRLPNLFVERNHTDHDVPGPIRGIYGPAFRSIATKSDVELGLRENDYVFGDLKVGTVNLGVGWRHAWVCPPLTPRERERVLNESCRLHMYICTMLFCCSHRLPNAN